MSCQFSIVLILVELVSKNQYYVCTILPATFLIFAQNSTGGASIGRSVEKISKNIKSRSWEIFCFCKCR